MDFGCLVFIVFSFLVNDGLHHGFHHGFDELVDGFGLRWRSGAICRLLGPVSGAKGMDADVIIPQLVQDLFKQDCFLCVGAKNGVNGEALGKLSHGWVAPLLIQQVDEWSLLYGTVGNAKSCGSGSLLDVLSEFVACLTCSGVSKCGVQMDAIWFEVARQTWRLWGGTCEMIDIWWLTCRAQGFVLLG